MQFLPMAEQTGDEQEQTVSLGEIVEVVDSDTNEGAQEVCCGGPPPPRSSPFELPGYELQHYVRAFIRSNHRDIALVKTKLEFPDYIGTLCARVGIGRDNYKVSPGLYGVGKPDSESPVIVTANYKLTFDSVRKELDTLDCWLLVLDTCGINVWCAAGKQTFSTTEIVRQVYDTHLAEKVNHRRLIVPQLGATGVAAHEVKVKCGFRVSYGPVQARDIIDFIQNDMQASREMRNVTFTLRERFALIPVEFYLFGKKIWWLFPMIFLLSGLGPSFFSLQQCWQRGFYGSLSLLLGGFLGAVLVPLLLPWIPCRSFSLKGAFLGIGGAIGVLQLVPLSGGIEKVAFFLVASAVSSYLAMNFTGSTPFTSPSGVEKEMKTAIPLQVITLAVGLICWLISPFITGGAV